MQIESLQEFKDVLKSQDLSDRLKSSSALDKTNPDDRSKIVEMAAITFIARRDRLEYPEGKFDNAKRWLPTGIDGIPSATNGRPPSTAFPYSYSTHCRTVAHVSNLFEVERGEVMAKAREIDKAISPEPATELER